VLASEQADIFDKVTHSIDDTAEPNRCFFIQSAGGCGKTFLLNNLLDYARSRHHIAVAVASTGIAALLLHGGTTAHSRFGLPLQSAPGEGTSSLGMQTEKVKVLRLASIIVWDEITMAFKDSLDILDVLLRDAMSTVDIPASLKPFGGKTIVLAGDWRQMLPVVPRGSRGAVVSCTVKRSKLWYHFTRLELRINMRVALRRKQGHNADELDRYAKWLLEIGDGCAGEIVPIPLTMQAPMDDMDYAMQWLFSGEDSNQNCILSPLNKDVDSINSEILDRIPGDTFDYFSADYFPEGEQEDSAKYPVEFLNSTNPSGMPRRDPFDMSLNGYSVTGSSSETESWDSSAPHSQP
jgi:hypothetical protein